MQITYPQRTRSNVEHHSLTVVSATLVAPYKIRIVFADRFEQTVDFYPFLLARSPVEDDYLDPAVFADFKIHNGNINWRDYDLIFSPESLRSGDILSPRTTN